MVSPLKLDTFVLKDKFGLEAARLYEEAHRSAIKRAEVMEWEIDSVRLSERPIESDGEYKCYFFDIWGFDRSGVSESESRNDASKKMDQERMAASERAADSAI